MTAYKILGSRWWTTNACVGIVAIETRRGNGEWKSYIGAGTGWDQERDEQLVAALGAGLQPHEAQAFFPHLDSGKYKQE